VSVIGSAPDEGHGDRDRSPLIPASFLTWGCDWRAAPRHAAGEEGTVGFAVDQPRFVMPDGSFLPTRLTGVLHEEAGEWKVVHLHFSVGVPDEQAIKPVPT
jgi:hypothetical protein